MAYTKQRLRQALLVFRTTKAKDLCLQIEASQQASKYALRRASKVVAARHLPVHQDIDSSTGEDEEYNPHAKVKKKRKALDETKQQRPKRKAEDGGDNEERRKEKRSKAKPRDAAMRDSKEAYITVSGLTSDKGKKLLQDLGQQHGTDVTGQPQTASRIEDQSQDPVHRDQQQRLKAQEYINAPSYMDTLDMQCATVPKDCLHALRNREVKCLRMPEANDCAKHEQSSSLPRPRPSGSSPTFHKSVNAMHGFAGHHGSSTKNALVIEINDDTAKPGINKKIEVIELDNKDDRPPRGVKATDVLQVDSDSEDSLYPKTRVIVTHWSHPMDFQYFPDNGEPPCDFCSNWVFGFAGHGRRRVKVLQYSDEDAYTEISPGHRSAGKQPTRMCVQCALQRLRIVDCPAHSFEDIPGIDLDTLMSDAYIEMTSTSEGRIPATGKSKHHWCSICTAPALSRCCSTQKRSLYGEMFRSGEEERGCGLAVCERCLTPISGHGGRLRERYMRKHADAGRFEDPPIITAFRADAEFLYPGSPLRKAYKRS